MENTVGLSDSALSGSALYGQACAAPTVTRDNATVTGVALGSTDSFLGRETSVIDDTGLTVNAITPATPESKLPVVVWIYGGAFELGGTAMHVLEWVGSIIVEKAISLGVPAVYVSMNYRIRVFASQEVKDAGVGNLERLALRWVQRYIKTFWGDPAKVTIHSITYNWGQSAGAISVALHMVTNGGNPEGDIAHGQPYYDALVAETGCSGAKDTLRFLREVPYDALLNVVKQSPRTLSYQSLRLAWLPRVDGVFLTAGPVYLVQQELLRTCRNCDDEGTIFSLSNANVTTDAELEEYIRTYYLPNASNATIEQVLKYYPSDPTRGSPFDTGDLNAPTPQFKRRLLLQNRSGKQSVWTYLNKRLKPVPFLGSFHVSDIPQFYGALYMASYLVRFVANLDPNVGESTDLYWPQYDATNQTMLELPDGLSSHLANCLGLHFRIRG
ncbi:alpha/beta-hydrolase [Imleria badia]|nr:alpha/beta-hydrolase [Imleria badia]